MTDTPKTIPEALEAAQVAVSAVETGYHDGISGDWHPYSGTDILCRAVAAIRALSDRIAAPVAIKPGQYVCERCGQVAWGGDHVCPGAPADRIAAPVAVVKPLEWSKETDPNSYAVGCITARPEAGFRYIAQEMYRGGWKLTGSVPFYLPPFPTLDAAKAAAQANYEARLLSGLTIQPAAQAVAEAVAVEDYYARQIKWSRETFGPGLRTKGVIQHIRKELAEIEADPNDLSEWVDVIILAMDGFWRHGGKSTDLMPALLAKQAKNMARTWPDWRTVGEDQAIEHDRSGEAQPADAQDALARRDAETRKAALREAAARMAGCLLVSGDMAETYILALIDKEPAHG